MLSDYHLKIADPYNILTDNVKILLSNIFNKEKYVIYIRIKIKAKNLINGNG